MAIALLCALFFNQAVSLRGVFFHYDHALQNYPYRLLFARALREGRFPLWTNQVFCGFPIFAESQSNALYPPFLALFRFLPTWVAYNYYHVLHFAMAGVFTYFLARVLGIGRAGGALAGICYMLSGPMLYHAHHTNIIVGVAWFPLLLALMELAFQRASPAPLLLFAGATAALALGAQPQYTLYCALACGLYLAWRLHVLALSGASRRRVGGFLLAFCVAGALGGIIAAAQALPLAEIVGFSSRGAYALPGFSSGVPGNLMTLLLPHYFGSPGLGSYWGNFAPGLYSEVTLFMGAAVLMPAIVAVLTDRKRRTLFLAGFAVFSFIFSLGFSGALYNIFGQMPVFRSSRFATRFAFVTALCVALLGGIGLEKLRKAADEPRVRRAALAAGAVALTITIVFLAITAVFQGPYVRMNFRELAAAVPLGDFELGALWRHLHHTLPMDIWRLVAVTTFGAALLMASARRLLPRWAVPALWCGLLFADLAIAGWDFSVVTDPKIYRDPPPLVQELRRLGPGRIFRYRYYDHHKTGASFADLPFRRGWALLPQLYVRSLDRLPPNSNMIWGVPSISGFCPLQIEEMKALLGTPHERSTLIEFPLSHALDLLGARYVLTPREKIPGHYQLVEKVGAIRIFENPRALPRAFIVHRAARSASWEASRRVLTSSGFDYRERILIAEPHRPLLDLRPGRAGQGESAQVLEDTGNTVTVQARLSRPGYLALADQYYPGWEAAVDGRPADLLRVDCVLKGVQLGAGVHTVRFAFRSRSFRLGLLLSGCGLAALLAMTAFCLIRRRRAPACAEKTPLILKEYAPRMGRFIAFVCVIFLALGPLARPGLWRAIGQQLSPSIYGVQYACWRAAYAKGDGDLGGAYELLAEACRRWPGHEELQKPLVSDGRELVGRLLHDGRGREARQVAGRTCALAPKLVRREAPALITLARKRHPEDANGR
ncbi:MAG: YfhO family protein [Planctomycetes bacterium]|nr:YfhO family protein [Planctomycetota bacterium]